MKITENLRIRTHCSNLTVAAPAARADAPQPVARPSVNLARQGNNPMKTSPRALLRLCWCIAMVAVAAGAFVPPPAQAQGATDVIYQFPPGTFDVNISFGCNCTCWCETNSAATNNPIGVFLAANPFISFYAWVTNPPVGQYVPPHCTIFPTPINGLPCEPPYALPDLYPFYLEGWTETEFQLAAFCYGTSNINNFNFNNPINVEVPYLYYEDALSFSGPPNPFPVPDPVLSNPPAPQPYPCDVNMIMHLANGQSYYMEQQLAIGYFPYEYEFPLAPLKSPVDYSETNALLSFTLLCTNGDLNGYAVPISGANISAYLDTNNIPQPPDFSVGGDLLDDLHFTNWSWPLSPNGQTLPSNLNNPYGAAGTLQAQLLNFSGPTISNTLLLVRANRSYNVRIAYWLPCYNHYTSNWVSVGPLYAEIDTGIVPPCTITSITIPTASCSNTNCQWTNPPPPLCTNCDSQIAGMVDMLGPPAQGTINLYATPGMSYANISAPPGPFTMLVEGSDSPMGEAKCAHDTPYYMHAAMYLGSGSSAGSTFESFVSPRLSPVDARCFTNVDMTNNFVMCPTNPAQVEGCITLMGPVDPKYYNGIGALNYLQFATYDSITFLPSGPTGSDLQNVSYIKATGGAWANPGQFSPLVSDTTGFAVTDFNNPPRFSGPNTFVGRYSLKVAGLQSAPSVWNPNHVRLVFGSPVSLAYDIWNTSSQFTNRTLSCGTTLTNNISYCFGLVTIRVTNDYPALQVYNTVNLQVNGTGPGYTLSPITFTGFPFQSQTKTQNVAEVQLFLPNGNYQYVTSFCLTNGNGTIVGSSTPPGIHHFSVSNNCPPCLQVICATNKTLPCTATNVFDLPTVASSCLGSNVTITTISTVTSNTAPGVVVSTRTWLIADPCGNTNTCTQTVTLLDTNPPVFINLTNLTVACGTPWSFSTPGAVDPCDCTNISVNLQSRVTNGPPCSQVITEIWIASNLCYGLAATATQTVTVVDTTPPIVSGVCVTNVFAFGGTNDNFVGPEPASPSAGLRSYLAGETLKGFDDCTVNQSFAHTIANLHYITAATLTVRMKPCGDTCINDSVALRFIGPDGLPMGGAWSRKLGANNGSWFSGLLSGSWSIANYPTGYVFTLDLRALPLAIGGTTDLLPQVNQYGFLDLLVQNDTAVDYVVLTVTSCQCATNRVVECGSQWAFDQPTAWDQCCGTNVTITPQSTVTNGSCPLVITRVWKITDCCTNSTYCCQTVTVVNTNPPIVNAICVTNVYFAGGSNNFTTPVPTSPSASLLAYIQSFGVTAFEQFDECLGDSYFITTFSNLPSCITSATLTMGLKPCSGFPVNDAVNLLFTGAGGVLLSNSGYWSSRIGSDQGVRSLLSSPWNTANYPNGQVITLNLAALPGTGLDLISYLNQYGFLDFYCQDDTGVDYLQLTVVSCCCSTNKTVECGSQWAFDVPSAVDACSGAPVPATILSTVTNGGCPQAITRTWLFTDACGYSNLNTCSQTVTVVNTNPPVFSDLTNLTVACGRSWIFSTPTAHDPCGGTNIIVIPQTPVTNGLCPQVITKTWIASNLCYGVTATATQTVTVVMTNLPVVNCPANIVVESCTNVPVTYNVTATSACCSNVPVVCTPNSGSPFARDTTTTVTCVATDCCGNKKSCSFTVTVQCPCLIPPSGLSAWWPFDELAGPSANDIAGQLNNMGTHYGNPTPTTGMVGTALRFDGINDFVVVTNQTEINFIGSCANEAESFTIDAWIRADANGLGGETLLDKRTHTDGGYWGYNFYLYNGRPALQIAIGGYLNYISTTPDLRDGQWHFIAVTVARCGTNGNAGTFYLDGNQVSTFVDPRTGSLDNSADLFIGRNAAGGSSYSGCLDELEICKRALSASELHGIFDAGSAGKCKCTPRPAGMSAWWPFDESGGFTADDIAGQTNNFGILFFIPAPASGMVSNAHCFDGINDYVQVANNAEINFIGSCSYAGPGAESFTIDAWIRANTNGPYYQALLDKRADVRSDSLQGYDFYLWGGQPALLIATGVDAGQIYTSTTPDLRDGQWHFIAVTVARCGTSGNAGTFYLDGSPVSTFLDSQTGDLNNSANLFIGRDRAAAGGNGPYSGCLDELEIYKRALSASELHSIFSARSAGKCKSNCLGALTLTCATNKTTYCPANYLTLTRVRVASGNSGSSPATSFTVTLGGAPANGHTLVAVIATRGTALNRVSSITQTGAYWTRAAQAANVNGTTTEIWYANNVHSAGTAVTIHQASLLSAAVVVEYSNVFINPWDSPPLDQTANMTGNSAAALTGITPTTSQTYELCIGGIGLVNSSYTLGTPNNGFTSPAHAQSGSPTAANNAKVYALERILWPAGSVISGGTVSTASQWSGAMATFYAQITNVCPAVDFDPPTVEDPCCGTNFTIITNTTMGWLLSGGYASTRTWQVTDCLGRTAACSQTLTWIDQPITVWSVTTCAGSPATFSLATNVAGLTYQWQVSYDYGDTFSDISDTATNATYTIPATTLYDDGNLYQVIVGGAITSSLPAELIVNVPATVQVGPNQAVCAGSSTTGLGGTIGGAATWSTWTSSGTGTFAPDATTLNAAYSPSAADIAAGSTTVTLTASALSGPCPQVTSSMTITILPPATVNAGPNQTVCADHPNTQLAGAYGATANFGYWGGAGTFVKNIYVTNATYIPTAAEIAAGSATVTLMAYPPTGSPCGTASATMTITINRAATVSAGGNQTICADQVTASLGGTVDGGATGGTWSTAGTGTFVPNNTALNATYHPLASDKTARTETLTLTTTGQLTPCTPATTQLVVTIHALPAITSQPVNLTVCSGHPATFAVSTTGTALTYQWQESLDFGTSWNNVTDATNASYTIPDTGLIADDGKLLQVIVSGACAPAVTSTPPAELTVNDAPTVQAGPNQTVCASSPATLLAGSFGGLATSATWSGAGTFSPTNNVLKAIYTPSAAEIVAGSATVTLTTDNPGGSCPAASATMTITINPVATASAGPNQTLCSSSPAAQLAGSFGGVSTSATWSGAGRFVPNIYALTPVYTPTAAEIAAGHATVTLTTDDPPGPCPPVSSSMTITIYTGPATANAGPNQTLSSSATTVQLAGSVGGGATGGTWSGGSGTFSPNASTLNAVYTPTAGEKAAGPLVLTLTSSGTPCGGGAASSTMSFTFMSLATLLVNPNTSTLAITLCLNPSSDLGGGNILDLGWQCTNQTHPIMGDMVVQLDSVSNPTQITLQDCHFTAMAPYVMSLTWTLGSLVVPMTLTIGTVNEPVSVHDTYPGTGTAAPISPDGSFTLANVPFTTSALAYYGGTASGSLDLSGDMVLPSVVGTILVSNEVASVHMDFSILETLYTSGDVSMTGYAVFNGVINAVGPTTVPRYMVWNNGAGTGNWNTADANWNHGSAIWDNLRPDSAIFAATGIGTVNLNQPVIAGSLYFQNPGFTITGSSLALTGASAITNDADATISAPITSGSLNKWGGSKLTLSGVNTYAGATTVGAGTLEFASLAAMGSTSGITVQNGAEASFAEALAGQTVSTPIQLGGVLHTHATSGQITFTGPITLQNSGVIRGESAGAATATVNLSSVIGGTGDVTFLGAGDGSADQATFVVSAANTYTQATGYSYTYTYTNGLTIRAWANVSDAALEGARFSATSPSPAPSASTAAGTIGYATQSINMNQSDQEAFTASNGCGVAAPGPFPTGYINSYTVEYRGKVYIATAGTYSFGTVSDDYSAIWIDPPSDNPTIAQATADNPNVNLLVSGSKSMSAGYHDIIVRYNEGTGGNGVQVLWMAPSDSGFSPIPGASFFTEIRISNAYAYGGNTYITNSGAIADVQLSGGNNRLPTSTVVYLAAAANSSMLDLNGNSQIVAGVADGGATAGIRSVRNSSGTASTLTLGSTSSYAFSGTVDGNLAVTKSGNGTQTLSGANTYVGNTVISAGTLALGSSLSSSSSVSLAAGATLDVSAASGGTYMLGSAAFLTASGTASAATIVGPVGGTVDLGSRPIVLAYDTTHPALSISQATLSLGGNAFTVNTALPLGVGDYTLIQQASGSVVSTGPCTVSGTAIGLGFEGSIVVSGGQVNLHIISVATPTTTTLGTIPSPQTYGSAVLTANVVAGDLTPVSGNVTFKDGATVLGTAPVIGGTATLTTKLAVKGGTAHQIQARFSDPAVVYASSLSGVTSLVITPRVITVSGTKSYNALPVVGAENLTVVNNVDGANLTLSGAALLAGKNAGSEAVVSTSSTGPARVQVAYGNTGSSAASSFTVTAVGAPVSGNTLVAVIATRGTSASRVTGITQNNVTWTRASQAANAGGVTTEIWYAPVHASAGTAIVIGQASALRSAAVVIEYSGVINTAPQVDQTASASDVGTAAVTGTTPMTAQAVELYVGSVGLASSANTLSSFLNSFNLAGVTNSTFFNAPLNARVYALDKFVTATDTANSGGTINSSSQWAGAIATFYGVPSLALGGAAAPNYTVAGVSGTVTVAPTNLTVTAATNTKPYDGSTTAAAVPTLTAGSIQSGDTAPAWTETYDSPNAGTSKTLTPAGLVSDGNGGANYGYTYAPNHTGVITGSSSSTLLVSALNPSGQSSNVTFTATVTGVPSLALPTGNVVFLANGTPFATNALISGSITANTTALPVGHNAITAQYAGDGAFPASSSSALDQVVTNIVICIATASAGASQTICSGNCTAGLGGSVGGGATGGAWTSSGSGAFAPSVTTLGATYCPSATDIAAGTVTLTLTSTGQLPPCGAATAQVVVTINQCGSPLVIIFTNHTLVLTWPTSCTLQYEDNLRGPWVDLPSAFSPYTVVPTGPAKYFRLVCFGAPTAPVTPLEPPQSPPAQPGSPGTCPAGVEDNTLPYLFSGEFHQESRDLVINGRGMDFVWALKYRSKVGTNTASGNRWDYSYNIRVEPSGPDFVVHDGTGRSDTYRLQTNGTYAADQLFCEGTVSNAVFTLKFPDTGTWEFLPLDSSASQGKINRIKDRNDNTMAFAYSTGGLLTNIVDTLGRSIHISYNSDGFISAITDFAGRTITYDYYQNGDDGGSFGDLKSVTSPPVINTPNGNDFPAGKTTTYTYSKGLADERLNHNLLTITDAKGQLWLQNTYAATTDPADYNFGRLIRQVRGYSNEVLTFWYTRQAPVPSGGFAVTKAIVNDRMGNVSEHLFDPWNRLLRLRQFTGRAVPGITTTETQNLPTGQLRASDPAYFETAYQWNVDAKPTLIIYPNGNSVSNVYELALNPAAPRRSRGNLRGRIKLPGALASASDQAAITENFVYDTTFGGGGGFGFATQVTDGRGNTDSHAYDSHGNRTNTIHAVSSAVEDFEYSAYGQMTAHVLPDNGSGYRRRDVMTYYTTGPQTGYLRQQILDSQTLALTTTYEYDAAGNVTRVIDPAGNGSINVVNQINQVVREYSRTVSTSSGPVRYQRDFFYDANNNHVRLDVLNVDEDGVLSTNAYFTTTSAYDILNRVTNTVQEVDPSHNVVTQYAYDANGNRTLVVNGEASNGHQPNNVVDTLYDERNLQYLEIRAPGDPGHSTTQFDYDGNGNVNRVNKIEAIVVKQKVLTYDGFNRWTTTTDAMGNVTTAHYDANGNVASSRVDGELTDLPGSEGNLRLAETAYTYDAMNRRVQTDQAFFDPAAGTDIAGGHALTTTVYSPSSQVLQTIVANNRTNRTIYDTANRPSIVTDAKGNTTTSVYDADGNVVLTVQVDLSDLGSPAQAFYTTNAYDGLDRLVQSTDNLGNTTSFAYDSRNNRVALTDLRGNVTRYAYDGLNRLTTTARILTSNGDGSGTPTGSIVTRQSWDDNSRLAGQADANSHTTAYMYDSLNRMTATVFADGTTNGAAYDVYDNPIVTTDANGNVVNATYDLLNRVAARTITRGPGVLGTTSEGFQYDGVSRTVLATNNDSRVTRSYDSLSHVTRETQHVLSFGTSTRTVASTYDALGNRLTCTYPGGRVINCTYEALNRKLALSDSSGTIANYSYFGPGRVQRRDYGNGTRADYTYDGLRRMTNSHQSVIVGGAPIDFRAYAWDAAGNKTANSDLLAPGQNSKSFAYDSVDRLIYSRTAVVGPTNSYVFDGVGNRVSVTGEDPGTYFMNPAVPPADFPVNQYTTTPFDARTYDANGNLVRAGPQQFVYDYRNRLLATFHFDGIATYTNTLLAKYDCLGCRVEKVTPAATARYYYADWQEIEEQSSTNTTVATYVWGNGIDELLEMSRSGQSYYYHADDLGSIRKVTDNSGGVVEQYDYEDYGQPSFSDGSGAPLAGSVIGNSTLFTGRCYDPETGLYYYRTRYLDPTAGRFTTRDSIGIWEDEAALGNGYVYVGNNPGARVDPYGYGKFWNWCREHFVPLYDLHVIWVYVWTGKVLPPP